MENYRGAALMVLAMLGFAVEDLLIKLLSVNLPIWQILVVLGGGGAGVFGVLVVVSRQKLFPAEMLSRVLLVRNLGEMVGLVGFVSALALAPLSLVSAVLQSAPLMVTMGAALVLGETVGWRRWSAILAGFFGVLLVIQPGGAAFNSFALLALVGVVGLTMRDLATRIAPVTITSLQMSFMGFLMGLPAAAILAAITQEPWVPVTPQVGLLLVVAIIIGPLAYYAVTAAMRVGEVSFVTPFRYSRMVFALFAAVLIFGERPDSMMLIGTAIIVASGLYTVWRERMLAQTA